MSRKVLCPSCGTTVTVGASPLPPPCPICKAKLPFTLPRTLAYIGRTFWRPVAILLILFVVLVLSPQVGQEAKREIFGDFVDIFRKPHPAPR